jgi:muramoyltetrapeptide carboxypeptidase
MDSSIDSDRFAPARALHKGSHVRVVAPSSAFEREGFDRAIEKLRERWVVTYDESIFDTDGYLAGSDARRASELLRALEDPEVDAIVAARGGYGAMRLLPLLPIETIAASKKLLVGFSDVTALHALFQRAGLRSLHASMISALGRLPDARIERWMRALEGELPFAPHRCAWRTSGRAVAPVVGGNLALLAALLGTPYFPPVDGAILLLEDVGEAPYKIDRLLTSLELAGVFDRVAGVLVGDFTRCTPGKDGRTVDEVITRQLSHLGLPALMRVPIGHEDEENWEVALGGLADLDADRGIVTFLQGAVAPA